ncbi:hypothetical protein A5735_15320 [Mycolicibacter heraklionensis]|nr:hypothetical protein A5735_15320 [Mycolicibacter heraklionensis]
MSPQVRLRSAARSPFCMATSKLWIVERTCSSCEAACRVSRVSHSVPSTAMAASARMIRITAITQPQLRDTVDGSLPPTRAGICCGAAFPVSSLCWAISSVSASSTDGMTSVCPASNPGAVKRRSGDPSGAGSAGAASVVITSVTASASADESARAAVAVSSSESTGWISVT